jgi:hypothetical protein
LLENGSAIRTVQELLGHTCVETTMIYLHVMEDDPAAVPHGNHASLLLLREGFRLTCRAAQDMVWRSQETESEPFEG